MAGEFYLFINYKQAAGCGHVGFGFSASADRKEYVFGSVDHLTRHNYWDFGAWIDYTYVAPGEDNDWWCETGDRETMLRQMTASKTHIWYHDYKIFPVMYPQYEEGKDFAFRLEKMGWAVASNNCVHQTYELAKVYGVGGEMLNPWQNTFLLFPNNWFSKLPGEPNHLREVRGRS